MNTRTDFCVAEPARLERELRALAPIELLVGIPSLNEADNIAHVVRQSDEGLQRFFPDRRVAIVNCDNASPDGTQQAFLGTETRSPKLYISTPDGVRGKGNNFLNLFQAAGRLGTEAIVVVDADLISISPEWIQRLAEPVVTAGSDLVTPLYARNEYDGTITNHLCYPLLYSLLSADIRQPIGGDFGLSGDFARQLVSRPWQPTTREYGIDIFLTLSALLEGRSVAQTSLGAKVHKPSAPKLGPMFSQVVTTLFTQLLEHRDRWQGSRPSTSELPADSQPPQPLPVDYKVIKSTTLELWGEQRDNLSKLLEADTFGRLQLLLDGGPMRIGARLWAQIVYQLLHAFERNGRDAAVVEGLKPLFFARVASFIRSTLDLDHEVSERRIQQQAILFRRHRRYLLDRFDPAGTDTR